MLPFFFFFLLFIFFWGFTTVQNCLPPSIISSGPCSLFYQTNTPNFFMFCFAISSIQYSPIAFMDVLLVFSQMISTTLLLLSNSFPVLSSHNSIYFSHIPQEIDTKYIITKKSSKFFNKIFYLIN